MSTKTTIKLRGASHRDVLRFNEAKDRYEPSAEGGASITVSPIIALTTASPGVFYTNEGATSELEITLPPASRGDRVTAYVHNTNGIVLRAPQEATIRVGGSVSDLGGSARSYLVGSCVELIAINDSEWVAKSSLRQWTVA